MTVLLVRWYCLLRQRFHRIFVTIILLNVLFPEVLVCLPLLLGLISDRFSFTFFFVHYETFGHILGPFRNFLPILSTHVFCLTSLLHHNSLLLFIMMLLTPTFVFLHVISTLRVMMLIIVVVKGSLFWRSRRRRINWGLLVVTLISRIAQRAPSLLNALFQELRLLLLVIKRRVLVMFYWYNSTEIVDFCILLHRKIAQL